MTRLGVAAALVGGGWVAGDVEVVDGVVTSVGLSPAVGEAVVAPGFVDQQVNGFAGVDLRSADEQGYATVADALLAHGVTTFLPTYYSTSVDDYVAALQVLRSVHADPPGGAHVGGAHLEGPFLSPTWAGAHDARHLVAPDPAIAVRLVSAGPVDLVTLAPELPGALDLVRWFVARDIRVSVGHTDATAEECRLAFDAGASMLTHCFNAHRRFGARDPGPAGAALVDRRVAFGVIADGHHLADDVLRLVATTAPDRMRLVSDAIAPAGTDAVTWATGGASVRIGGGRAELSDGTLAGSVTPLDDAVRRMVALGVPPEVALRAAAGGRRLAVGSVADLVVLDDGWRVADTLVARRRRS